MTSRQKASQNGHRANGRQKLNGMDRASEATAREIAWLWPGALPVGSVTLLEGRKATGKSTIAATLAAATTAGRLVPGWTGPTSGSVLWVASEDPWESVVVPRLRAAGADLRKVWRLLPIEVGGSQRRMILPDDLPILRERLQELRPALMVLDPFVSLAAPGLDLRVEQQARAYLEPLGDCLADLGVTGLLLRHLRKSTGGDAREAGLGSVAVGNVARSLFRCDEHPYEADSYCLSVVASNWGQKLATQTYRFCSGKGGYPVVEWTGEAPFSADDIQEGRGTASQRDEATDADLLILTLLASGPVPYTRVWSEAQAAGITQAALRATKVRLRVVSKRVSYEGGGHWEWAPPKGGFPVILEARRGEGGVRARTPHLDRKRTLKTPKTRGKVAKVSRRGRTHTRTPPTPENEERSQNVNQAATAGLPENQGADNPSPGAAPPGLGGGPN